ncbi:TPA: hypothetical protein ACH3X2_000206 [Trebouxia sp. C0005]
MQDTAPVLQRLQMEAYRAVLRAMAVAPMQYEQEKLLTSLRKELHVEMHQHAEVLQELNYDEEVNNIRDALSAQRDGHTSIGAPIPVDLDIPSSQLPPRGPGRPLAKKPEATYGVSGGGGAARGRPPGTSRNTLEGGGGSARLGKRNKHPMAQLVEVDIPGGPAVPQRAPVARDASVDPYIGRHIMRFWPSEGKRWHRAIITDYDPNQGHCIVYKKDAADEAWEWVNFEKLRLNAETANGYKWVDRPPSAVGGDQADHRKSLGPGGKRKRAESECPVKLDFGGEAAYAPFHEPAFRQHLAQSSHQELTLMQQMLDWRESEIQNELMLLDVADDKSQDSARSMQCQLDALVAREKALHSELQALAAY